ncbi:ATP-binding protein [Microbacterium arabinogalactanolyticum]|uniref:ATP-binding protein n=1 Tax=Microbacterium arabinogalactanolyticum TaxID=69365 RepID=UPI002555B8DD|nr:SbcC/MukB-like Walker B domain-containing protein [Microbacterium arabinogalactanolyticum]GLC85382.1 ATP-binding protein [Microbacterium arabinogalactanolyticum]
MTMLDTLFGLIPAESRGQQWVAEDLQLVNWGGYDGGPHRVRFSPNATLLCGGSGSGKSTLMDAYIALMMPHTTPFNGASNGGVTGRPRGDEQRNILSYGRGKIDESRTEEGTKLRVLRGDGEDTWTAIAMTWRDHDDSRFTAIRAWYIPAGARILEDTVRVRATIDGDFDLARLESAASQRLSDASLRELGLETLGTDREFSARLHAVLGIGAAGSGAKAMSLLARIQAGQQITTVDDLYKRLVLEEPETMATADAVVAHFDELESTRTSMITARQQVNALEPIAGIRERIADAAEQTRLIDEIGDFADPDSRAALWRAQRRLDLLREVESELGDRKRALDAGIREKKALVDAAEVERDGLLDVLRQSGGDRLETAQRELRAVERRLAEVQRERARVDAVLDELGLSATTAEEFAAVLASAHEAEGENSSRRAARAAFADAETARRSLMRRRGELDAERQKADAVHGSIPSPLHEARMLLARAAGLDAEDLPFVGELIEVRTEFEPWREAFNLALGGFATTLLIDAEHVSAFRAAIDQVRTPIRLRYEGVNTGLATSAGADGRTLPGRLDFRPTPFTGWLQQRLDERFGFVCVDSSAQLSAHSMALTITGQMSQGNRGAHGGHDRDNVLGFSNERRLHDLERQLEQLDAQIVAATDAADAAEQAMDAIENRLTAFAKIQDVTWEQIDVDALAQEVERWASVEAEVTGANPEIAQLKEQAETLKLKASVLRDEIGSLSAQRDQVAERWGDVTDDVDDCQRVIDAAEGMELDAGQTAFLDDRFILADESEDAASDRLARLDVALKTAAARLAGDRRAASEAYEEQRERMRQLMASFLERWPNLNLLPDPDESVAEFEGILEALKTSGLHELESEWRDSLLGLSGNDLTSLDSTLSRSVREIRERIEPINSIMRELPFYDDDHRLQISPRENQSEARKRFRRDLREVRGLIEAASTDEERENAYRRMSRLIGRMRRTAPDFAELIDVRNHVRVSAERVVAATGEHVALYDHIGEKSGGESQELVAFIVGAALRYQLGDAGAERPRYAPVFMDEALIKADAHFTKRAIGAWRGLGFQLVIGAPNDKYSAIEPHVDVEYTILKDTRGRSWAKPKVAVEG